MRYRSSVAQCGAHRPHDHGVALKSHPRARLRELYGESSVEAKRDQALAQLFARSGWTQEELGKKEGKSQDWISLRLRFGRFLNFTTAVVNSELPRNLTEWRFRELWEQTDKTETRLLRRLSRAAQLPTDSINRRLTPARTRSRATPGQRAMIAADETSRPASILERR